VHEPLLLVGKLKRRQAFTGSAAVPAHAMHFPTNAGLIFLTDELNNDKYLVDTGVILSIVTCTSNSSPSGPILKGANGLL
jgi:hypothetical protein